MSLCMHTLSVKLQLAYHSNVPVIAAHYVVDALLKADIFCNCMHVYVCLRCTHYLCLVAVLDACHYNETRDRYIDSPCQNNGACINGRIKPGNYTCVCANGFNGPTCGNGKTSNSLNTATGQWMYIYNFSTSSSNYLY